MAVSASKLNRGKIEKLLLKIKLKLNMKTYF